MSNEESKKIEQQLDAIDARIEECSRTPASKHQEAVAPSTYKLAIKVISVINTRYAIRLKLEDIRVDKAGNITMSWFDRANNPNGYISDKCSFIYLRIKKRKVTCYGSYDHISYGITEPMRYSKEAASLMHTVFNVFYRKI